MTFRTVFRRKSALEHRARKPLDVLSLDGVHASLAECGRDVHALHRLAVLPIRQPRAFDVEAPSQLIRDLVDGRGPLLRRPGWATSLRLDQPPQAAFRLGARETVGLAARANLADAPIDATTIRRRPTPVVGAPFHVELSGAARSRHGPHKRPALEIGPRLQT
jgi:hypothetical protein